MSNYDFTTIVRDVAAREGIEDYKLEQQYSSSKGDGYTGTVCAVTLIGSNKSINVVFKYSHRNPAVHESVPLRQAYLNEIHFYEKIAPAFRKFQEDYNIEVPFDNSVKYYGCINEPLQECLAMENLRCHNYDLWDRTMLMNEPHLELALQTFAKLHSTSMAMKNLQPDLFFEITSGIDEPNVWVDYVEASGLYKQISDMIIAAEFFDPETEKQHFDKVENFRTNLANFIDPVLIHHDEYDVLLQGDCWCNNAMYQYSDMNKKTNPINMKLLDWQVIKTGCVVMDLSYFFYTIAPKESIDNLDYYLKIYYESLRKYLEGFNLNVEIIFPYKVLKESWQKTSIFGLMMAITLRKMMLVASKDAPDFADGAENFLTNLQIDKAGEIMYKEQMRHIINHFIYNEVI